MQKSSTTEVNLEWPVNWKGGVVDRVTVRRPKAIDNLHLPDNLERAGPVSMYPFFSSLIVLPGGEPASVEFIYELDNSDLSAIGELIGSFSQPSRAGLVRRKPV